MTDEQDREWIDRHDREHEVPEEHTDCEQCLVYLADREHEEKSNLYRAAVQRADSIADAVTAGRSIAGFSGIQDNTRRIARAAAFRSAMLALDVACPQCSERNGSHRYDCGFQR